MAGGLDFEATLIVAFATSLLTTASGWMLARNRMLREFRLHFRAEAAAKRLLEDKRYRLRTFQTLKHHLGGFEDDELRKILVQAGAIRFADPEGVEIWGLLDRVRDMLEREYGTSGN